MTSVTLIAGGSNGIGRAISQARQALAETVLVLDRMPPPASERAIYVPVDLADTDAVEKVMREVTSTHEVTRTWLDMERALNFGLDFDRVITHSFLIDDFREAISTARTAVAGKVLFDLDPLADA